jgi:hypothetical protein
LKKNDGTFAQDKLLTQALLKDSASSLNFETLEYLVFSNRARIDCQAVESFRPSSWTAIDELVATKKVIFVGEQHGGLSNLKNRDQLFAAIARSGRNVEIVLEMFKQDDQTSINQYLEGRIDEGSLEAAVGWNEPRKMGWGWPFQSYQDLLQNARARKYKVWGADNKLRDKENRTDEVLKRAFSESGRAFKEINGLGDVPYRNSVMIQTIRERIRASQPGDLIVVYTGSEHTLSLPLQMPELGSKYFGQIFLGTGKSTSVSHIAESYTLHPLLLIGNVPDSYVSKSSWVHPLFVGKMWISHNRNAD